MTDKKEFDVIEKQERRICELERLVNEAIDTIEDMAGGPCYPSTEYRKRLELTRMSERQRRYDDEAKVQGYYCKDEYLTPKLT